MRRLSILLVTMLLTAQSLPAPPANILGGLADAQAVTNRIGDQLWPGLSRAPYGFLFVHAGGEMLINDPRTPDGFTRSGTGADSFASGPPSWRNPSLLAAMPVFGPPSVIVMGSPEATGLAHPQWQLTIQHEHFHQWQSALPEYYARVDALNLAGDDQTGMWMLNYPFPYQAAMPFYAAAAGALHHALAARTPAELRNRTRAYLTSRRAFQNAVTAEQWRYFDFQLWQEGGARWTEIEIGLRSRNRLLTNAAQARRAETLADLAGAARATAAREIVYSFGAGEAMLLERIDPDWRGCYRVSLGLTPCWDSLNFSRGN
jgi:hypothetical protein